MSNALLLHTHDLALSLDPFRAATHNKGIMNAIDAIALATGNDWRALEAGVHAYASRSGQYQSISHWNYENQCLSGEIIAPISVGIVGGIIQLNPMTRIALNILKVKSAQELARIIAAIGLVQNLGALRALVTNGIVKGHMNLHISNLILKVGAKGENERTKLHTLLFNHLNKSGIITETIAQQLLKKIRKNKS